MQFAIIDSTLTGGLRPRFNTPEETEEFIPKNPCYYGEDHPAYIRNLLYLHPEVIDRLDKPPSLLFRPPEHQLPPLQLHIEPPYSRLTFWYHRLICWEGCQVQRLLLRQLQETEEPEDKMKHINHTIRCALIMLEACEVERWWAGEHYEEYVLDLVEAVCLWILFEVSLMEPEVNGVHRHYPRTYYPLVRNRPCPDELPFRYPSRTGENGTFYDAANDEAASGTNEDSGSRFAGGMSFMEWFGETYVSYDEVIDLFDVHKKTVDRYLKKEDVRILKLSSNKKYLLVKDFMAFLEANTQNFKEG